MTDDKSLHTGGFFFEDKKEEQKAEKELSAVLYIRDHMDWSDTEKVLLIYRQMIESRMFVTPVGRSFLRDIQNRLEETEGIKEDQVPDIFVAGPKKEDAVKKEAEKEDEGTVHISPAVRKEIDKLKDRVEVSHQKALTARIISVILLILVALMFLLTLTAKSPTILTYRTKVMNEYSEWEEELNRREDRIREKETELGISPEDDKNSSTEEKGVE